MGEGKMGKMCRKKMPAESDLNETTIFLQGSLM